MWQEVALIQTSRLPEDRAQVESDLTAFISASRQGFYFDVYSAVHPMFIAGLDALLTGFVPVKGVVDHTQQCGPAQAKAWAPLLLKHGHAWVRFGSSPAGKGFINHEKVMVQNAAVNGAPLPPALPLTSYNDWHEAIRLGQSATWDGSWNIGPKADQQVNDVNIVVSQQRAQTFCADVDAHFAWIDQHEADWNAGAIKALLSGDYAGFAAMRPPA